VLPNIEQIVQERLFALFIVSVSIPLVILEIVMPLWFVRNRSLDDFVQFPSVQPDSAALRAIVNFDPLAVTDEQGYVTSWAIHVSPKITYE
jgi:hypothetical protein